MRARIGVERASRPSGALAVHAHSGVYLTQSASRIEPLAAHVALERTADHQLVHKHPKRVDVSALRVRQTLILRRMRRRRRRRSCCVAAENLRREVVKAPTCTAANRGMTKFSGACARNAAVASSEPKIGKFRPSRRLQPSCALIEAFREQDVMSAQVSVCYARIMHGKYRTGHARRNSCRRFALQQCTSAMAIHAHERIVDRTAVHHFKDNQCSAARGASRAAARRSAPSRVRKTEPKAVHHI
mmetsp:Transcript_3659/g.10190  ORF Transcript_3659/g.10190 Transcript_3659/m.10190 type:complete len:244 (-) Transcript_3659:281-1012(-)